MVNGQKEGILIAGHKGTWYIIDSGYYHGGQVFLLEHETYGDEAACIIVNSSGTIVQEDVWNGLSDLV